MTDDTIFRQAALDAVNIKNLHRGIVDALRDIIEEIPSAQSGRWIPCSERMPFDAGYYLTTTIYNEVFCDYWNLNEWNRMEQVIAWMPLPEPYGGEQDG